MARWNSLLSGRTTHTGLHVAGGAAALGAAVAFYQFVYAPLHRDVAEHAQSIARVQLLTDSADGVARTHREVVARLEHLTRAAAAVRERMPLGTSASDFVEQAGKLAAALDLEVRQCQSEAPRHHAGYSTIDVSCELVGDYASICRYLTAIDQLPQISQVQRLDITRGSDSGGYPVEVTFQLYYQVDPNDKDSQRGTL